MPQVDEIILLENGSIVEMGSYDDLIASKGPFSDYLQKYSQQQIDEENIDQKMFVKILPIKEK